MPSAVQSRLLTILAIATTTMVSALCQGLRPSVAIAQSDPPAAEPRYTFQPARLEPYERTPLHAKVQGFVLKSRMLVNSAGEAEELPLADIGDHVHEGEPLAEIDIPEMREELKQKEASAEQAAAELQQASAAVTVAEKQVQAAEARIAESQADLIRACGEHDRWKAEHDRIRRLAQDGTVTGELVDETVNQLKAAEAGRDAAEARVTAAQADHAEAQAGVAKAQADEAVARARIKVADATVGQIRALLKYAEIRAPYPGVVTQRNIDTGHFVQLGIGSPPLFVVERIDTLRVAVDIPERDALFVHKGNSAWISVPALGQHEVEGTVSRTSWALDAASRTLRVEIDLPNSTHRLRPGMYAKARIELTHQASEAAAE